MDIMMLGSGAWGTALANLLCNKGHRVIVWSHLQELTDELNRLHHNPRLEGVELHKAMEFSSDISEARTCAVVVFAVPSFAMRTTARQLRPYLQPGTVLVSATKGIEENSGLRMSQIIKEETQTEVVVLSGASHAEEVSRYMPTGCVAACANVELAEYVQELFMNEYFRIYTSDDVIGVELSAAMKNVIALCAGICDGLGFGDNTKALLMTRGLAELKDLVVTLGGRPNTFAGLAGVGDTIVTCTSMHSRNRRAGILIGQGVPVEQAMEQVGAVVEGYYAAGSVWNLSQKTGVEMPICQQAYAVLYKGKDPAETVHTLMGREKKPEF